MRDRGALADKKLALLRQLLSGDAVEYEGRRIRVTPSPHTAGGPMLDVGRCERRSGTAGGPIRARAVGERNCAGHAGGLRSGEPRTRSPAGTALLPERDTPTVCFVADDVDRAWEELGEYLLHDVRTYAAWNPGNDTSAGISFATDVATLRATSTSHVILSVDRSRGTGPRRRNAESVPVVRRASPELAWPYLKRVGEVVLPEVACASSGDGLNEVLGDMLNSKGN